MRQGLEAGATYFLRYMFAPGRSNSWFRHWPQELALEPAEVLGGVWLEVQEGSAAASPQEHLANNHLDNVPAAADLFDSLARQGRTEAVMIDKAIAHPYVGQVDLKSAQDSGCDNAITAGQHEGFFSLDSGLGMNSKVGFSCH